MSEHREKYGALVAAAGGAEKFRAILPSVERIRACLDAGDEHLNRIGLAVWDRIALGEPPTLPAHACKACSGTGRKDAPSAWETLHGGNDWPYMQLRRNGKEWPWTVLHTPGSWGSLSDRICLLKEAARQLADMVPA